MAATRLLLKKDPKIDGIFCFNDLVALGALDACSELGIKVPEQVAIVGFDDIMTGEPDDTAVVNASC